MRIPSEPERAWAAAIVSGEGSIGVHTMRGWTGVRLTVGQTSDGEECPQMLTRLLAIFGVGRVYRLRPNHKSNKRPVWQFYIHGFENVQAIVAMMWDWLTPEKQTQATMALRRFWEARYAK